MGSNHSVLLLNATFEPLTVITARRALKLIFARKAHTVEHGSGFFATIKAKVRIPSVIQIVYYVKKPYSHPRFSKKAVFIRDNYKCQYCGKHTSRPTIDHIVPRSKGGKNDWYNIVTACHACNNKKGDRTLKTSRMKLKRAPFEPKFIVHTSIRPTGNMENWEKYFGRKEHPDNVRIHGALTALAYGETAG